jgi:hypothetical protein
MLTWQGGGFQNIDVIIVHGISDGARRASCEAVSCPLRGKWLLGLATGGHVESVASAVLLIIYGVAEIVHGMSKAHLSPGCDGVEVFMLAGPALRGV